MSWDAMLAWEQMEQIRADHGRAEANAETQWWENHQANLRFGVSALSGFRAGWWAAIEYVLDQQNRIDDLTVGELLTELRKGPGSLYWPLKADDPTFWADCPRCHTRVLLDIEGFCRECAHEFEEERTQ